MKKQRQVVETITEVVLATILLAIFGVTFATISSINPVAKPNNKTVLGAQISAKPFEILQADTFEQSNYIGSANSFGADYTFAVSQQNPTQTYGILKLSNSSNKDRRFAISFKAPEAEQKWFKIAGKMDDTEYVIFDALGDAKLYDLVITLKPNTEGVFNIDVNSYSESAPLELHAKVNLEVLD